MEYLSLCNSVFQINEINLKKNEEKKRQRIDYIIIVTNCERANIITDVYVRM